MKSLNQRKIIICNNASMIMKKIVVCGAKWAHNILPLIIKSIFKT